MKKDARDAQRLPRRPFWLTEDCPTWCTNDHQDEGCFEDRFHVAHWQAEVVLSLVDVPFEKQRFEDRGPEAFLLGVEQHVREVGPHIVVSRDAWTVNLTIGEARQLAEALTTGADLAEGHWGGSDA